MNKTDFDILEKVQERAFRFIHNDFVSDKRLLLEQSNDISIRLVTKYGSVLVSWCAKNRHILTAPEEL